MLEQIVYFLTNIANLGITLATRIFDATETWPLVFAAISITLICKFILGPILGFTASGASDMVSKARSDIHQVRKDSKKR